MRREVSLAVSVLAACALGVALAAPAHGAQTINVSTTSDTADASPANGLCELPCSLRAAVQTANGAGSPGADTIVVPAGAYDRAVGGADGADPAATGDLDVTGALTITGAGQASTTIDAKSLERGFDIAPGVTATISGLTITGGLASDGAFTTAGGAIRVGESVGGAATLTLNDVTLRANAAQDGAGVATDAAGAQLTLNRVSVLDNIASAGSSEGGGVNERFGGTVDINNSLIKGNVASFAGGVVDDGGGVINITDSTVTENSTTGANGHSGGISETGGGTITITRSIVSKNTASTAGGISEDGGGTVTIVDSTISENMATTGFADGGGVLQDGGGTVTIRGSTITGNKAGAGAGLLSFGASPPDTFDVSNTTISGNHAVTVAARPAGTTGRGGGVRADGPGTLQLTNVTLRNNLADAGATEIDNCNGAPVCSGTQQTITLRNTIVAGAGTNCAGPISSGGHNLDSANSCALTGTGDLINTSPLLGPLADNGGPTFTHAELDGSPTIDKGNAATCPALDQRGTARPQGAACDIGAFERAASAPQCSDGSDNDGDGAVDFPGDQGCENTSDVSESPDAAQCSDRLDNDGDGAANFPDDPDCTSATDISETPEPVVPDTEITSGSTGTNNATFAFRAIPAAGATFECWVDGGGPAPCTSLHTTGVLEPGSHTFHVRAQNANGTDPTPATRAFVIGACQRPAKIGFKLHRVEGTRVVRVEAFANGKRALVRRGSDVRRVELAGLKRTGTLTVRIVATHNTGSKVVSTRRWVGCRKGKPKLRHVPRPGRR